MFLKIIVYKLTIAIIASIAIIIDMKIVIRVLRKAVVFGEVTGV